MKTFDLTIITPQGMIYDDTAELLSVMGLDGSYGVMAHHAPMLAVLCAGTLKIRKNQQRTLRYRCSEGVLDVRGNRVTVLADQCSPLDFDPARAR